MAFAYKSTSPFAVAVAIGQVDSGVTPTNGSSTKVPSVPLGTIITGYDDTYGGAEFIFLKGVASTVDGSIVTYSADQSGVPTWQTVLAVNTAGLGSPIAVARGAYLAANWGWYQISGAAVIQGNGTFATATALYISSTAGMATTTQGNGLQILGARTCGGTGVPTTNGLGTTTSNLGVAYINRPHCQGQVV